MEKLKEIVLKYVCNDIKKIFENIEDDIFAKTEEIRIRLDKPLYFQVRGEEIFLNKNGVCNLSQAYYPNKADINGIMELISRFSIYAFEEEIKQGFIPLQKGIRVGISGKAVLDNGQVKTIKNISSFNFRIPSEVIGCSEKIIDYIVCPKILHTLIISPPCCGKTTLLRDIIRTLSSGIKGKFKGVNVGVADERSELGGVFFGKEENG